MACVSAAGETPTKFNLRKGPDGRWVVSSSGIHTTRREEHISLR